MLLFINSVHIIYGLIIVSVFLGVNSLGCEGELTFLCDFYPICLFLFLKIIEAFIMLLRSN